jgi:ABC-type nitrate/sulfonate/bicarbonate transport system substrate-binding protein
MKHKSILLLLALMMMAGSDLTATAQSLKVGMTSKTLFYLPFYVGQKRGFYTAQNLKVELILIGRSACNFKHCSPERSISAP